VQGPHPTKPRHIVYHWFEMCDAVQNETYEIDGVSVSNFVLPLYFTSGEERGGRNDFLGTSTNGKTLESFAINPGGYINYFDPAVGRHGDDVSFSKDKRAAERLRIKQQYQAGRGQLRKRRREF